MGLYNGYRGRGSMGLRVALGFYRDSIRVIQGCKRILSGLYKDSII